MDQSSLSNLSNTELRSVSKKNFLLFGILTAANLVLFYYSLYHNLWINVFLCLGYFIVGLSLYDNYSFTKEMADQEAGVS
jgi:hypothetical protein